MTPLLIFLLTLTLFLMTIPKIEPKQVEEIEEIEEVEPLWDDNKQHTENFF